MQPNQNSNYFLYLIFNILNIVDLKIYLYFLYNKLTIAKPKLILQPKSYIYNKYVISTTE